MSKKKTQPEKETGRKLCTAINSRGQFVFTVMVEHGDWRVLRDVTVINTTTDLGDLLRRITKREEDETSNGITSNCFDVTRPSSPAGTIIYTDKDGHENIVGTWEENRILSSPRSKIGFVIPTVDFAKTAKSKANEWEKDYVVIEVAKPNQFDGWIIERPQFGSDGDLTFPAFVTVPPQIEKRRLKKLRWKGSTDAEVVKRVDLLAGCWTDVLATLSWMSPPPALDETVLLNTQVKKTLDWITSGKPAAAAPQATAAKPKDPQLASIEEQLARRVFARI